MVCHLPIWQMVFGFPLPFLANGNGWYLNRPLDACRLLYHQSGLAHVDGHNGLAILSFIDLFEPTAWGYHLIGTMLSIMKRFRVNFEFDFEIFLIFFPKFARRIFLRVFSVKLVWIDLAQGIKGCIEGPKSWPMKFPIGSCRAGF